MGGLALPAALAEAGPDGDVLVVDADVDRLEQIRRASAAPNVFFLIGDAEVLPLLDGSVDVVLGGLRGGDIERVLRVP